MNLRSINGRFFLLLVTAVMASPAATHWAARDVCGADSLPSGLIVNPDTQTNDSKPSLAVLSDGSTWLAWHAYSPGCDRICTRRLSPDGPGPIIEVSQNGTAQDAPRLVAAGNRTAWAHVLSTQGLGAAAALIGAS